MPKTIIKTINEPFEEQTGGKLIIVGTLFFIGFSLLSIAIMSNYPLWIKLPLYGVSSVFTLLFLFSLSTILF